MKVLIADDERMYLRILESWMNKWDHETVTARDGLEALEILLAPDPPKLAILDWQMPEMDGVDVCRRIRSEMDTDQPPYLILLTAREGSDSVVEGLEAGADDYVTKPFDPAEMRARIQVGIRVLELQADVAHRVNELQEAIDRINTLQGMLPICANCKNIRDDSGYWYQIETYISEHSDADFSHGICPPCMEELYPEQTALLKKQERERKMANPVP